ncbi:class C beta-lactamase-related serine hydrolase [Pedobacter frigiditerrae]|uniref:Class C beta-lactamase-related serine hydrolase n=1 Tax=Pedobacter frigiditerrae TaxID=2530452 RepID=A0A4R0MQ96_9SPHI|nr:serine hydrolase [Pedobacter frigiditerrae]TCC89059.1 class C beta-lactamase-related serine hydrolase [Pedobacter frigiditerrae]
MMQRFYAIALLFISTLFASQSHAQQLTFFDFRPARDSVQTSRAISSYNIGSDKDLYFLLSPSVSLEAELAKLAPSIKTEELLAMGNYSFDFYVDGKKVYTENLGPGAILPQDKITNRPLDIVLMSSSRSGLWSINLWDRFMAKAGLSLLNTQPKVLAIQISVYVNQNEPKYSSVLAQAKINMTRIPKVIDPSKMGTQPIAAESGFKLSKEKLDKKLIVALNTKIAEQTYRMINGIVVLKKGELLLEQYYNGEKRETLHDPRSVSKSVTATLTGMAIKDGFMASENQMLKDFYKLQDYANYSSKKDSVKIGDLLSMSAAFDGNDEVESSVGNEENMYPTADYTKFTLDLPMVVERENGKKWTYFTAGTNLVMDILDKNIPGGVEAYANKSLFAPLSITKFEWARTPQGKPFGGGGLRLRALDFAKYGQLYLNGGIYNGKRLLEESWVKKSLSPLQVLPADRPGFYGLLFWNKAFVIAGKSYEVYYSSGNGGNKIYMFKDLPLVIVITASAYGKGFAHAQADEIVEKYLLPAIL